MSVKLDSDCKQCSLHRPDYTIINPGSCSGTVKRVHVIGVFRCDSGFEPCVIRSYALFPVEGISLWKIS